VDIQAYIESGAIESYVLGLSDAAEAVEVEQLSHQYPEIKKAIDAFEVSLEQTAFAHTATPYASVKENLFTALQDEFAQPAAPAAPMPVTAPKTTQAPVVPMGWLKYVAAASVILLISSAALNIYFYNQFQAVNNKYTALLSEKNTLTADNNAIKARYLDLYSNVQLMNDPAMAKVPMPGVPGKENDLATVFWDTRTKDVYVLANKLPQAAQDKQYQLWALVDGKPVDAGLLEVDCNGLCKLKNIPRAQAFAITLENKGGSPTPHLDQLFVMGKV